MAVLIVTGMVQQGFRKSHLKGEEGLSPSDYSTQLTKIGYEQLLVPGGW